MSTILALLAGAALLVGMFGMIKPIPTLKITDRKRAGGLLAVGLVLLLIAPATQPPEERVRIAAQQKAARDAAAAKAAADAREAAAAEAVRRDALARLDREDPAFREISRDGPSLYLKVHIETAWDEAGFVGMAAQEVETAGKALQKPGQLGEGAETARFTFTVAGTDRLGQETEIAFMNLDFKAHELRAANFDNLSGARVMNLATRVDTDSPQGIAAIRAWCLKDDNLADATSFCRMALGV